MSCYYRFGEDDVFHNRIKTHPSCEFYIYSGSIYYNNEYSLEGTYEGQTNIDSTVTVSGDGMVTIESIIV